jgi:hypothetical protein
MPAQMKRNLVVEREMQGRNKRKNFKQNKKTDETLMEQQRRKEKEVLKEWKAARESGKKNQLIIRKQSRDVRRGEKERFAETDASEYDDSGFIVNRAVWKHEGCNTECLQDNCQQYMLEYLYGC